MHGFLWDLFYKNKSMITRIACYSGKLQIDDHEKTLKLLQLHFSLERNL